MTVNVTFFLYTFLNSILGDWPVYQLLKKTVARAGVTTEKVEEVKKMFMSLTKLCQQDLKVSRFKV